jgi:hypothetical protein
LQVGRNITITYSATDYITGTITAISEPQITMTITHVASATYTSSTIYSNNPATNQSYVGVNNPDLTFTTPPYSPLSTTVFKSGTVYLGGAGGYNPQFVLSIKDMTTGITYGSADQAWTNTATIVPINFTGGVVVPAGTNIHCPITGDGLITVNYSGGPSGELYYSTYPFPGSLQGYTLPYSVGVITLTPISWTISPSITFASVPFGGNVYIGTGPDNVIPAPTNSDSSIAYSAVLVAPSNLQPCVSVTQAQGSASAYLTLNRPDPLGSLAEYNIIATQYGKTASIRIKFSETNRHNVGLILVVQVMNV